MSTLRERAESRLNGLENERLSWWVHWRELASYILPRRYRWLVTPNEQRGGYINGNILDSTGTIAARTLSAGMMSGKTSPSRPWFNLSVQGYTSDETNPVTLWLEQVRDRMLEVFAESNFYNAMAVLYSDLAVFNTATMLIYEDFDDVIRCYNPCAGEYYLANSSKSFVNVFARKFTLTVQQLAEEFGEENLSQNARSLLRQRGAALSQEIIVAHLIEPNTDNELPARFPYRELYWEWGADHNQAFLRKRGFFEPPFIAPRWDTSGNDAYGRGPSMDALGDIKQLQQETKRKAQALDKMVNPPMLADATLKNQPASLLPGGVTYVAGLDAKNGMRPTYTVMPPIQEIMQDIAQVQQRIKTIFYNDLFLMFQELTAEPRSAAAVDVRREEKLTMLGPFSERFDNEALDPIIDRVYGIMLREGLFPPPPAEIQNAPIKVEYVSMFSEAQRAAGTVGIERIAAFTGNLAAADPSALDKLDIDQSIDVYARLLSVTPQVIRSDEAVAAMRAERAKQQQTAAMAQATMAGVDAAKTLSETEVGGGQNALQMMMQ